MQHDTALADRDVCIAIRGERKFKAFEEVASELADKLEAGAELAVERGPAYLHIVPDGVQPVRKPDIDIDRHRAGADRPQRTAADRHRMLAERLIELLV